MKYFNTYRKQIMILFLAAFVMAAHAQKQKATAIKNVAQRNANMADTLPNANYQTTALNIARQNDINDSLIENRLVALALKQPQYEEAGYQRTILDYQLKKQRNNWLNLLSLSTSYNDQSFKKSNTTPNTAYVYPKYFFGVTIPIGLIVANSTDVKITRESALIAEDQQLELAKTIKANVISNYKQYKAAGKLIELENQIVDDAQADFLQTEQKFRDNSVTIDVYNDASRKYNEEQVKLINLQLQQDLIKVELERLIGQKLENIIKPY